MVGGVGAEGCGRGCRSFVLEHVRTRLFFDGKREIPADFKALYGEAAEHPKTETEGPGQSGLIKKLLLLPIGAVANMLATFESSFTVIYDPREKKEVPVSSMVAMAPKARAGERTGALHHLVEHGLQVEARADAQARCAQP